MPHAARRKTSRRLSIALLAGTALAVASCTLGRPSSQHTVVAGAAMWLPAGSTTRTFLAGLGWQHAESPLYTDDQRLHTSSTDYGPYAAIYPAATLDTMTNFEPAIGGRLVAVIDVVPDDAANPGTLPQTYLDLKLSYGKNCIYLRLTTNSAEGYVVPANPSCALTNSAPTSIPVSMVKNIDFPGDTNIPAVARFHEGANQSLNMAGGAPFFGLKCNDAWCRFVPATVVPADPPQMQTGADKQHRVNGWGDAQRLGKPRGSTPGGLTPAASRVIPSGKEAWIVADPNLGAIGAAQFQAEYQRVAIVRFRDTPTDKYRDKWRFGKKENEIWIKAGDASLTSWTGYVLRNVEVLGMQVPFLRKRYPLRVDRDAHPGMTIPATARFRWNPDDDDIWVRCDDGCCKVSEGMN